MSATDPTTAPVESLHTPLIAPPDLGARITRALRQARETDQTHLAARFDLEASAAGILRLHLGRGRVEASTRQAALWAARARHELAEYLTGARSYFSVPIDLSGLPEFQRTVLRAARDIPFGSVRPYRWVAERIGHPGAVRAVGTALGKNPVPVLIPCHRVLRADGSLGGYVFGLGLKERLLALERDTPALVGCTTTRILCRRGCPHERRVREDRRVVFASVGAARALGYRPCRACRPAA